MRYAIVLDIPDKAGGVRVEPALKLKQLLKIALRGFGIRAVTIDPAPTPHAERSKGGDGSRVGSGTDRAAASQPEALANTSINPESRCARAGKPAVDVPLDGCKGSDRTHDEKIGTGPVRGLAVHRVINGLEADTDESRF